MDVIKFEGQYYIENNNNNEYIFIKIPSNSGNININITHNCIFSFTIIYKGCHYISFNINNIEYKLLNHTKYNFTLNKYQVNFFKPYILTDKLVIKLININIINIDKNENLLLNKIIEKNNTNNDNINNKNNTNINTNINSNINSNQDDIKVYKSNNDLMTYITHSNLVCSKKTIEKIIMKYNNKNITENNNFNVDHYFYKYINNISIQQKNKILKDISETAIENGLIYYPKQIINLFEDIKIYEKKNESGSLDIIIKYEDEEEDIRVFVKREIYDKDFNWYVDNFIKMKESNISDSKLLLIVFIGDIDIGNKLIDKIIYYKTYQSEFGLGVSFRNKRIYEALKMKIINNFNNYCLYITNEFGSDIIPSLLTYNNIKKVMKFEKIIKLQTKTDNDWFNELVNFLLSKSLDTLTTLHLQNLNNSNCLGVPSKLINTTTKVEQFTNSKLNIKYKHLTNKKYFVAGTIFFCEEKLFEKIINFIEHNNYRAYFTNNLYDTNIINISNSVIHYLERLFGIISLD